MKSILLPHSIHIATSAPRHAALCMLQPGHCSEEKRTSSRAALRIPAAVGNNSTQEAVTAALPEKLVQARQLKQWGLLASGAFLTCGLLTASALGVPLPELPHPPGELQNAAAAIVGTSAASVTAVGVKKRAEDTLAMEWHNGRLYLQLDVPPRGGPRVPREAIEVKPAGTKGNGAFARQRIPKGSFIGNYEGEMLSEAAFWQRYPAGEGDFCMKVDSEWTIDAVERARDTLSFSPVHMNHSAARCNIARRCSRADQTISCYASRDIEVGEELLLDYGALYWRGREHLVVD